MTNPIRVAIVGCGRISDLHQMGYRGRDDAKIIAVCDTNKAHAKKKASEWGVGKVYSDYKQVLEDKDIDVVELLTPHHLHCPDDHSGSRGRKHISVQKPMALSAAEADMMISAAIKAGVIYGSMKLLFITPAMRAKAMIEAGEIGEIRAIRMHINTVQVILLECTALVLALAFQ